MNTVSRFIIFLALPITLVAKTATTAAVTVDASKFATLQSAMDALPEAGGIVTIPPGTYELTQPLVVKTAETRIQGAGASTHLVNKNEEGQPLLLIKPANLDKNPKAQLWRVQVDELRLSGNPKSGDGIHAEKIQEIFVHGVSIDHNGGLGINLVVCYEDPRINDSIITYNGGAGLNILRCHDIVVNGNHFEENQDAVSCVDSFNLCCNANNIDDHLRHGIVIENTYGSVVSGNMIEECNGTAIILDRDCYGITLSSNVIAHHLEGGIDLKDAWGCAVSANTFVLAHKFSVRVGKDSGRLTISANNFCNSYMGAGTDKRPAEGKTPMSIDAGTGILLQETADVTISGNNFGGLSAAAVWAEGKCQRVMVSGNVVSDCGRKLPKDKPLLDLGGAENSLVKDNIVQEKN
jgi:hypothetical protein